MSISTQIEIEGAPGVTEAELWEGLAAYTDIDHGYEEWVGRKRSGDGAIAIGWERKWGTEGADDLAIALSIKYPEAQVTFTEEWDSDGAGGREVVWVAGIWQVVREKGWHETARQGAPSTEEGRATYVGAKP